MNRHPLIAHLANAGFSAFPLNDIYGWDSGLTFVRRVGDGMEVISSWGEGYARAVRLVDARDWDNLYKPTLTSAVPVQTFTDAVAALLPEKSQLLDGAGFDRSLDVQHR